MRKRPLVDNHLTRERIALRIQELHRGDTTQCPLDVGRSSAGDVDGDCARIDPGCEVAADATGRNRYSL